MQGKIVTVENIGEIKAVAFDIDGTLYKAWRLNVRMAFHFLRHNQFFLKYGLTRRRLHQNEAVENFNDVQAADMAMRLRCTKEEARSRLDAVVYKGLEKYFSRIKPCRDVVETVRKFKEAGLKIALLSDFPPEQKGDVWGIKPYCDVVLGTEFIGALKPSPVPFAHLADRLGLPPEQILYVGNSYKYDVVGSKSAGMKSAWFISPLRKIFCRPSEMADISFCSYLELQKFVLGEN